MNMNAQNMKNQYEFIEHVLLHVDFTEKQQVIDYAEKLVKALDKVENVDMQHREVFENGLKSLKDLTLAQMKDLKNVINE